MLPDCECDVNLWAYKNVTFAYVHAYVLTMYSYPWRWLIEGAETCNVAKARKRYVSQ